MYFSFIYDMIREFRLMCIYDAEEREGLAWTVAFGPTGIMRARHLFCHRAVHHPDPHYQLSTLLYSQPCPTTDGIYPTPMLYIIYNAHMHFSSTPKCFASPCVTVLHSCASVCTWGHFMSKMPARHLFCHTFHRLVCNWYV